MGKTKTPQISGFGNWIDGGIVYCKRTGGGEETVGRSEGVPFWRAELEMPVGQVKEVPSKWFGLCVSLDRYLGRKI